MIASMVFYLGLVTLVAGTVLFFKPRFPGIRTRRRAAAVAAAGFTLALIGLAFPIPDYRVAEPRTRLDEFAPVYQFHEIHSTTVRASKERVYLAIRQVTAGEILFFRTLIWLRRAGQPGPESMLNAPEKIPLIEVATRSGFVELASDAGRELALGTVVIAPPGRTPGKQLTAEVYARLDSPGFAKATMNFLVEEKPDGQCLVTTVTRVHAIGKATGRRFAVYWRIIYPGSALIRRMWLRAIRLRAEA